MLTDCLPSPSLFSSIVFLCILFPSLSVRLLYVFLFSPSSYALNHLPFPYSNNTFSSKKIVLLPLPFLSRTGTSVFPSLYIFSMFFPSLKQQYLYLFSPSLAFQSLPFPSFNHIFSPFSYPLSSFPLLEESVIYLFGNVKARKLCTVGKSQITGIKQKSG